MGAGAGLEDGVFRTGAGPDPGMGTSAPFLCHEIVYRGALSVSRKPFSGKSSHSGTFSTHPPCFAGSTNAFCKGLDSRYFRLCGLHTISCCCCFSPSVSPSPFFCNPLQM